eukprot:2263738-Rhodomonas_salina.2
MPRKAERRYNLRTERVGRALVEVGAGHARVRRSVAVVARTGEASSGVGAHREIGIAGAAPASRTLIHVRARHTI